MQDKFESPAFPRASRYHPEWIKASVSGGANPLWLTEWLSGALDLRPGMRVLDLGCGRAMSSIFLGLEFGLQVWAVDQMCSASENYQRIEDAGLADRVFPIHADARSLPFAAGFFDAIISIDSFFYYGTDDLYLNTICRFLKPGGQLAIAGAGFMTEIQDGRVPEQLSKWWTPDLWCLHSAGWWQSHWGRTGIVDVELADTMPDGWRLWLAWHEAIAPDNKIEIDALKEDSGKYLGYVRVIGRKRLDVVSEEPMTSIPGQYNKQPLLR
ncbi:MAG: class I SAM-dependent methyltransferase [Sphingobacteriales bacterium]|nr:MAG: class I SAM-dependent methyltransferase [Sphingobacteriales bacterium]